MTDAAFVSASDWRCLAGVIKNFIYGGVGYILGSVYIRTLGSHLVVELKQFIKANQTILELVHIDSIDLSIINFNSNTTSTTTTIKMTFSEFTSQLKAHHESLNHAYSNYYSPRASMSYTPQTSRKSSTTSQDSQQSERNITKAWNAIKKHHREMNEAYSVFYSPGVITPGSSRSTSANPTPRVSFEGERMRHDEEASEPRNYQKAWRAIKNKAVAHHRSVNSASAAVYGA